MTRYNRYLLILLLTVQGCGVLLYRSIACEKFSFQNELVWYAGSIGDTVTFNLLNGTDSMKFYILNKRINHTLGYTSDTGCGCIDKWSVVLANDKDTLGLIGKSISVNNSPPKLDYRSDIFIEDNQSDFIAKDRSFLDSLAIGSIMLKDVVQFNYQYSDKDLFNNIYIAKDIGIVQFERVNGEIWTNSNLVEKKDTSWESFKYSETTCK